MYIDASIIDFINSKVTSKASSDISRTIEIEEYTFVNNTVTDQIDHTYKMICKVWKEAESVETKELVDSLMFETTVELDNDGETIDVKQTFTKFTETCECQKFTRSIYITYTYSTDIPE